MHVTSENEPVAFAAQGVTLLYDPAEAERVEREVLPLFEGYEVQARPYDSNDRLSISEGASVATYLEDTALVELMTHAATQRWWLGVLPHPKTRHGASAFGIASDMALAVSDLLGTKREVVADLFRCNGQPVLHSIVVGEVSSFLSGGDLSESLRARWRRACNLLYSLRGRPLHPIRLTTQAEKDLQTAALGIVAVEHWDNSFLSRGILAGTSVHSGRLHVLLVSPRSVLEIIYYFLRALLPARQTSSRLPSFVGHIASASVQIKSPRSIAYSHDGILKSAERIELDVVSRAVRIAPGRHFDDDLATDEPKDIYDIRSLPVGEACAELVSRPLPFRRHAATEEFKELFVLLREGSRMSNSYLVLMVLSTLMATLGLFASSGPVIIGAMILAPLMTPIMSLAMGTLRQYGPLITDSVRTLGLGVLLSIACAALMTGALPLRSMTPEIVARLNPTLLDLGVAVIAGVAGAYAHARSQIARSLAGVAIAVALVPPLAVVGIGLAWLNWSIFSGSALLFLTNLAGMVLSASLTFTSLGFSPFRRARRGLVISLICVLMVSIPLALGFRTMVKERNIVRVLEGWNVDGVTLRQVAVRRGDTPHIEAHLISSDPIGVAEIDKVKLAIEGHLGQEIRLEATVAVMR